MNTKLGILSALLISIAVVETGVLPSGAQDETHLFESSRSHQEASSPTTSACESG